MSLLRITVPRGDENSKPVYLPTCLSPLRRTDLCRTFHANRHHPQLDKLIENHGKALMFGHRTLRLRFPLHQRVSVNA
jgi:hypothetical protein